MRIWGRLRWPRGLSDSPSKPISSLLTSPYKTFSPLCAHNKLLGQKSFQVWGGWFSFMWSTFQRTQLLTILVNEIVLQFLAAQTPRLHSAPPLGSAPSWLKARPIPLGSLIARVGSPLITSRVCFWTFPKALPEAGLGKAAQDANKRIGECGVC